MIHNEKVAAGKRKAAYEVKELRRTIQEIKEKLFMLDKEIKKFN